MKPLTEDIEDLFRFALEQCDSHIELRDLRPIVEDCHRTLHAPMRVAFVGRTNAGKSTMMNAFLGEQLAPTGNGELTFNVSWFRHGPRRRLLVHTVDGDIAEETFDQLADLAARCEQNRDLSTRIRYIEVQCPNRLLEKFDLIDTPGLHSFYGQDSRNTRQLLTDLSTRPHAIVFLFSNTLHQTDVNELERFHQACGSVMSGLTAIGALTKVDESSHGLDDGLRIIRQLQDGHPQLRRWLYTMVPVIGPMGYGAQVLSDHDRGVLAALHGLDETWRRKLQRDAETFCQREIPGEPAIPAAAERKRLFERLGRYGIRRALELLAGGTPIDRLGDDLLAGSNVQRLRNIVESHFGNRAFLIKARSGLAIVREQAFLRGARRAGSGAAQRIAARIDSIIANELRFREFELLERYYGGGLALEDDEVGQLLGVTGEHGSSCARRLGASDDAPLDELAQLARRRELAWRARAHEPLARIDVQEVARVLAESFGEIRTRVEEAAALRHAATAMLAYEA